MGAGQGEREEPVVGGTCGPFVFVSGGEGAGRGVPAGARFSRAQAAAPARRRVSPVSPSHGSLPAAAWPHNPGRHVGGGPGQRARAVPPGRVQAGAGSGPQGRTANGGQAAGVLAVLCAARARSRVTRAGLVQTRLAFTIVERALGQVGASLEDVVRWRRPGGRVGRLQLPASRRTVCGLAAAPVLVRPRPPLNPPPPPRNPRRCAPACLCETCRAMARRCRARMARCEGQGGLCDRSVGRSYCPPPAAAPR